MAKRKAAATRRKITELTRQKATAGKRRKLIWDTIQRGLALAVEPTGRQSFKFVYRWPPGAKGSKPVWLTWAGLGLADAREKAAATWKLIYDGVDPRGNRQASLQDTMTFAQLHRRYVDEFARKNRRRWRETEQLIEKHLVAAFGSVPAAEVSRADVREAISKIRKAGKDSLANRVLGHAAGVFKWAIREGVVETATNPAHGLGTVKPKKTKPARWLAETEMKSFWTASAKHGAAGAALRLMLLTGQRGGDVRRLTAGHIEDGRWWNLPASEYKSDVDHRVFLGDDALAAFAEMKWGSASSVDRREVLMQRAAEAIAKELKQKPWTPHSLRHTVISHLARMGVHKEIRARVVGHAEGGGVHGGYTHHSFDPEKRQVMRRWEAELRRIREGRPADGEVVKIRSA